MKIMSAERKLSLAARVQQTVEEVKARNATLDQLEEMDQDISETETLIGSVQGQVRKQLEAEHGKELQDLKVDRLGTLLQDDDIRGRYLARKKPQIINMSEQVKALQPGKEGKEQLNALVKKAIMSGFLEGAALADSGNPDIGNLRVPQVGSKSTNNLLVTLQRGIVEVENNSIYKAVRQVRNIRNPRALQDFVRQVTEFGWINSPLPQTELGNVDFSKLKTPEVGNPRVQASYAGLVKFIKGKAAELLS